MYFVVSNSDLFFVPVIVVMYVISCYIGLLKMVLDCTKTQTNMAVQHLRHYIGTSAFADISYLMADVKTKIFVTKCTEHQPKFYHWPMLMNIISQMLQFIPKSIS